MFAVRRLLLIGILTLAVLPTQRSSSLAQASAHRFVEDLPVQRGPYVRLEGDDERLQLREYLGTGSAGTVLVPYRTGSGRTAHHSAPILRRQYATLGGVGESIPLRPGVYGLTVRGTTIPRRLYEAHSYEVSITSDVTALRLSYMDRHPQRMRRWLAISLVAAAGGLLCLASTIDGIESPDWGINAPLMFTGVGLVSSMELTIMIPLFTRDDARIDVVYADGRVERARRRVRN